MRKVLFLAMLLGLLSSRLIAQTYYPVSHMAGPAVIAGQTVTVTPINPPNLPATYYCGVGPYFPGQRPITGLPAQNGFRYQFSAGVTHIRITMADIHTKDTMLFTLNGTPYVLTPADIAAYAGTCSAPATSVITPAGTLTSSTGTGIGAGATIILQTPPTLITDVRIQQVGTGPSDGVCYTFEFAKDSCSQKLTVTNNAPCATRKLILNATAFPGATFDWTGPVGFNVPNGGPQTTRDPVLINMGGFYVVTVHWGSCVFKDSTQVDMITKATPVLPTITVKSGNNPGCKNSDLTLTQVSTGAGGIQYYWYGPGISPAVNTQDLALPNIQPSQQGTYFAYAIATTGCISDTASTVVTLLPDVTAGMSVDFSHYGCVQDTIIIQNLSTGNSKSYIYMDPYLNSTTTRRLIDSAGNIFTTVYHPNVARDTLPDTFDIKIVVTNGTCYDSTIQRIVLNHPLRADFTVSDDTICQLTPIDFTNTTSAAAGPTHKYLWDFRSGDTAQIFSPQYTYLYSGVYDATLYVTDYLGCIDSAKHRIFVDSTGAITFSVSPDSIVCAGQKISFAGDFTKVGTRSTTYTFGDADSVTNSVITQHAYEAPGTFTVKFIAYNRVCPDTSFTRTMTIKPYPLVDLGPDTTICPNGTPIKITEKLNAGNPLVRYKWNNETHDTTSGIIVRSPGTYSTTVDLNGCATTDSIRIFKNCYVNIPNSFTPDEDGLNDYFLPRQLLSKGVKTFKMDIFNRWGQIIFETTSIDGRGWDGKFNGEPQPAGVYIYLIDVSFINGTSEHYTGNVTLLR